MFSLHTCVLFFRTGFVSLTQLVTTFIMIAWELDDSLLLISHDTLQYLNYSLLDVHAYCISRIHTTYIYMHWHIYCGSIECFAQCCCPSLDHKSNHNRDIFSKLTYFKVLTQATFSFHRLVYRPFRNNAWGICN